MYGFGVVANNERGTYMNYRKSMIFSNIIISILIIYIQFRNGFWICENTLQYILVFIICLIYYIMILNKIGYWMAINKGDNKNDKKDRNSSR
jgi:hypothetical protein